MSFELRSTFLMAIDESYSGTITWNNGPIFFVFWLFLTYLIVTGLFRLVKRNYALLWLTVLMVGFIGYKFQLPMTLDTAMTCSPFVAFGMTIRNKTNFLYTSYSRIQKFWSILIAFCGIFLLIFFDPSPNYFYCNQYGTSFWGIYVYGIIGTLSILLMAKSINKIKAVNYIGRYSIVILGVHNIMINDLYRLFIRLGFSQYMQTAFVLIIVLFISVSCIYVFTKYIPKLVAQKDLISINW